MMPMTSSCKAMDLLRNIWPTAQTTLRGWLWRAVRHDRLVVGLPREARTGLRS
jgi:hypothetical protein